MKQKRSIAGETMVESLLGMMIVALVFVFLVNAIATVARINDSVKNTDVSFDVSSAEKVSGLDVSVSVDGNPVDVDVYELHAQTGETRYYYYERQ